MSVERDALILKQQCREPYSTDYDLIAHAERVTGRFLHLGDHLTFSTYPLIESADHEPYASLTDAEFERLKWLQLTHQEAV